MRRLAVALGAAAAALLAAAPASAATSSPNDPYFAAGQQWALSGAPASIDAPPAWCAATGSGVTVAVVDTGADFSHPDLGAKLVAGASFLRGGGDPARPDATGQQAVQDDNGHGTMVSGLIGALTNNGAGIAAVAPDAKLLVVKVLAKDGSGKSNDVGAGVRWAVDNGARVINLSLGSEIPVTGGIDGSIPAAIDYAAAHGVAVAIAAGNSSLPFTDLETQRIESEALVVGALRRDGGLAYYSSSGRGVNIYAPGGDSTQGGDAHALIVSTALGGGYAAGQGTSFATPEVAGALALLLAAGLPADQARQRLLDTAASRAGLPELEVAHALGAGGSCTGSTGGTHNAAPPFKPAGGFGASQQLPVTHPSSNAGGVLESRASQSPAPAASPASHPLASTLPPELQQTGLLPLWLLLAGLAIAGGVLFARLKYFRQ